MKRTFVTLLALGQLACGPKPTPTVAAAPAPGRTSSQEAWQTRLGRDHPLTGKLWDMRARVFVSPDVVSERLAQARFVLLGEKHDNPDHHRLQARLLAGMVEHGRRPAVVLEMLEVQQQVVVEAYWSRPSASAAGFGTALGWQETSWPPFGEYQPIFEVAAQAKLPIAAGNLAQADARNLVKRGLAALPPERARALRLEQPLPEALAASLAQELRDSHCGHLPERLIEPMALAQRARDAQLAEVMASRATASGAVLIAGAGHARLDRGVPHHLRLIEPGAALVSVALQEVARDEIEPRAYVADGAFDFVWFTPRASDEDPCAAFARAVD